MAALRSHGSATTSASTSWPACRPAPRSRARRSRSIGSLHRRLGAPLSGPHIAYVATAPIRRMPQQEDPVSVFHGFHVAGAAGLSGGAPMRALTGWRHRGTEYVSTCNGVVLLASAAFSAPCSCTLWNPAVADVARQVTVPEPSPVSKCLVLGFGYGRRSKTYKILLCRKDFHPTSRTIPRRSGRGTIRLSCGGGGQTHLIEYSLAVHSLGDADKQTPPRTVLSDGVDENIRQKSLYMDGTIYLVHLGYRKPSTTILVFDVDDETVSRLDVPRERQQDGSSLNLELIEMSGRPCLVTAGGRRVAMWLLAAADRRWERACVISDEDRPVFVHRIIGIWDCGGVLVLYFELSDCNKVWLYDVATKKLFRAEMPGELTVVSADCYEISWGYKPTLVSPASIVGEEFDQDLERRRNRSAHITGVISLLGPLDRRREQEATLNTVCLMEFLVRIMRKLPHDLQDVVEMPGVDSEEPAGSLFESSLCSD